MLYDFRDDPNPQWMPTFWISTTQTVPIEKVPPLLAQSSLWASFSNLPLPENKNPIAYFLSDVVLAESSWWFFTPTQSQKLHTTLLQKLEQRASIVRLMQKASQQIKEYGYCQQAPNHAPNPSQGAFLLGLWVLPSGATALGIFSTSWHKNDLIFYNPRKPSDGALAFIKKHLPLQCQNKEPLQTRWLAQRLERLAQHPTSSIQPLWEHLNAFAIQKEQQMLAESMPLTVSAGAVPRL